MRIMVPYSEAKELLKEGDVLLFRPQPREKWWHLPRIGWFIAKYTGGEHSHVGLVSRDGQNILLVEFREWRGGRAINLENEIQHKSGFIDVYRVLSPVGVPTPGGVEMKVFTDDIAVAITDEMFRLTGLPYGWSIIWKLLIPYIPGLRLINQDNKFDNNVEQNIYVCSTAVNYVYRKYYMDPVPGIADSFTKPSDLAQSPLFQYQFTLT